MSTRVKAFLGLAFVIAVTSVLTIPAPVSVYPAPANIEIIRRIDEKTILGEVFLGEDFLEVKADRFCSWDWRCYEKRTTQVVRETAFKTGERYYLTGPGVYIPIGIDEAFITYS